MDADGPGSGAPRAEDRPPLAPALRWSAPRLLVTALAAYLAAVVTSLLVAVALGMRGRPAQQRGPEEILAVAVLGDGALLLVLFVVGRALLRLEPSDLGFRAPPRGALRLAAAAGVALWLASILVNAAQIQIVGPNPQPLIVTLGAHTGLPALLMDLATAAVVAPLAEEPLFRGLLYAGLAQRMPLAAAAAVSGLLFALSHGLGVVAPIFVLGLGLAYVYTRTRSIWAAMLTHSVVNAISLLLLFAIPRP